MSAHISFDSDEKLVRVLDDNGEPSVQAVEELFKRHIARVYSFCRRYFAIREDAEEAASETFFRAFRGLKSGQFRGDSQFKTWLLRIASNTCLERVRQPRLPTLSLDMLTIAGQDFATPEQMNRAQQNITDAIRQLPDDQSLAITLCDLEGYSAKEAAIILGRSPEALKSLHYRARRALREMLEKNA